MSQSPIYRTRYLQIDPITYNPITGGTLITFLTLPTPGRWRIKATARRTAGAGSTAIGLSMGPQTGTDTPYDGGPSAQAWPSGGVLNLTPNGWVETVVPAGSDLAGYLVGNGANGDTVDVGAIAEWLGPIEGASP